MAIPSKIFSSNTPSIRDGDALKLAPVRSEHIVVDRRTYKERGEMRQASGSAAGFAADFDRF
jgi:hypothetical protein